MGTGRRSVNPAASHPIELQVRSACALKPMWACVPSQNGLLEDCPQRHSVTRFRGSYSKPSADTMVTPPRTQIGPLESFCGSSMSTTDGSKGTSRASPSAFTYPAARPQGRAAVFAGDPAAYRRTGRCGAPSSERVSNAGVHIASLHWVALVAEHLGDGVDDPSLSRSGGTWAASFSPQHCPSVTPLDG